MLNLIDVPQTAAFQCDKDDDDLADLYKDVTIGRSTLTKQGLVDCSLFSLKNKFKSDEKKVMKRFLYYVGPSLLFS